ncbi:MAG: hypothetical protein U9Q27_02170 [Patescibacteria group bacterium]|nr:hypothetical protein [Patescibacteria group bacterium]
MFKNRKKYILVLIPAIISVGILCSFQIYFSCAKNDLNKIAKQKNSTISMIGNNSILPIVSVPENKIKYKRNVIITAYSSTVWQTDSTPFITASGNYVKDGIIANNLLPFGTKVRIPEIYGDKIFVVEDRMHWKKSDYHIDIWFDTYNGAKKFGAQKTYMEVLEN